MSPRERSLHLWQQYSQNATSKSLELQVAQRALRANVAPKDVMLMLVTGSPIVRQIYQTQGKQSAMDFASHIVRTAGLEHSQQQQDFGEGLKREMEIGD